MPRQKTHKFALRVKGLTDEQALQLAYIVYSSGRAFAGEESEFGTNLLVSKLRKAHPAVPWHTMSTYERKALV